MEGKYGEGIVYALQNIIWYDGHFEWLKDLRDDLLKFESESKGAMWRSYSCPIDVKEWHTEHHCIWMLLVGMFGDWGTSIKSGWIEKIPECVEFIDEVCKMSWEAVENG